MVTASPGTVSAGPAGEISASAAETAAAETSSAAPETSAAETVTDTSGPAAALTPGWHESSGGWYYVRENGNRASGERLTIEGYDYWFGDDGKMITGWHHAADGGWYYLRPSFGGMKKSAWIEDGGRWYYVGADGKLLTDTVTPDGYHVDANGVCTDQ